MESFLGMTRLPVSCALSHCCLCITALMINVPVRKLTKVLLPLIIASLTPPLLSFLPACGKFSLVSVFSGSTSAVTHPSAHLPLPPLFSFLLSPLFDLPKPPPFIHSVASLLPHISRMQDLCVYVCLCHVVV